MKTLKKIIWFLVILAIIYIALIFIKPVIADSIAKNIWLLNFNEKIRTIKKWVDIFSTKIPTKDEIVEAYSGAKNKVEEIKWNINNIRETADDLGKKYDEAKDFIDETWEKINNVKDSLNDLENLWKSVENIVNKEAIK